MFRAVCLTVAGTCGLVAVGIVIVLLIAFSVHLTGCHDEMDEAFSSTEAVGVAPAAPAAGWTAQNVRVKSFTTTATHIVVWLSYEIDGTRTVSRRVDLPKGAP